MADTLKALPPGAQKLLDEGRFCPIPFVQLQLNAMGKISACCFSEEHNVGNVADNSIEEIWNGSEMQKWRQEFLDGDPKICEKAIANFGCQKFYQHLNHLVVPATVQSAPPRRLDLRLNGRCNLECVMCTVWQEPNGLYDATDLWTKGPEWIFPHLKEVDMLGGEPFIQKDTFRFIEEVRKVNTECTWGFITNCHYKLTSHIEELLLSIPLRHIHMSLDATTAETYANVRLKGRWDLVMETANAFVRLRVEKGMRGNPIALFASFCVQRGNWHELPDFITWCERRNIQPIIQDVVNRADLNIRDMSPDERKDIHAFFVRKLSEKWRREIAWLVDPLAS